MSDHLRRCTGRRGRGCAHRARADLYSLRCGRWMCERCIELAGERFAIVEHPSIPWVHLLTTVRRAAA